MLPRAHFVMRFIEPCRLLLVVVSLSMQVVGFRQPFEYFKALQAFQTGYFLLFLLPFFWLAENV